jgi:hypothetical protein
MAPPTGQTEQDGQIRPTPELEMLAEWLQREGLVGVLRGVSAACKLLASRAERSGGDNVKWRYLDRKVRGYAAMVANTTPKEQSTIEL